MFRPEPTRRESAPTNADPRTPGAADPRRALRAELARFLRRAAERRAATSPFALLAGLEPEPPGAADAELVARARWIATSTPEELARAALRLEAGARGELALGRSLLAQGDPGRALEVLGTLLSGEPEAALRWRALEGVALAHEQRGNDRLALGASEAATRVDGCGLGPRLLALFLALACGDADRVRRHARDLDRDAASLDPAAEPFRGALVRLRLRVEVFRGGLPFAPPTATAELLGALASASGDDGRPAEAGPSRWVAHCLTGGGAVDGAGGTAPTEGGPV